MYVGRQVWIFMKIHFLEAENRTRRYIGSRNLLIILAFHNETYVCFSRQVWIGKREFSKISVQKKPRFTTEVLFLFQEFGLKYWPIEIIELFLVNGCKVADIKFQQIPYNWRINTARIYIFPHGVLLVTYWSSPHLHLLWSCGSSEICEFWVISLHCKQRYRQKIHYCPSKLHLMCGWLQPQLQC